jgi:uncharacterized membrane protein YdfJ with MMPL/SSD domain
VIRYLYKALSRTKEAAEANVPVRKIAMRASVENGLVVIDSGIGMGRTLFRAVEIQFCE